MAFAPFNTPVSGCFREKEFGNFFEFSKNEMPEFFPDMQTGRNTYYTEKVWVTDPSRGLDQGWRHALVKKTVAYVVVNERDDGTAVIQKWNIKGMRNYNT